VRDIQGTLGVVLRRVEELSRHRNGCVTGICGIIEEGLREGFVTRIFASYPGTRLALLICATPRKYRRADRKGDFQLGVDRPFFRPRRLVFVGLTVLSI